MIRLTKKQRIDLARIIYRADSKIMGMIALRIARPKARLLDIAYYVRNFKWSDYIQPAKTCV